MFARQESTERMQREIDSFFFFVQFQGSVFQLFISRKARVANSTILVFVRLGSLIWCFKRKRTKWLTLELRRKLVQNQQIKVCEVQDSAPRPFWIQARHSNQLG